MGERAGGRGRAWCRRECTRQKNEAECMSRSRSARASSVSEVGLSIACVLLTWSCECSWQRAVYVEAHVQRVSCGSTRLCECSRVFYLLVTTWCMVHVRQPSGFFVSIPLRLPSSLFLEHLHISISSIWRAQLLRSLSCFTRGRSSITDMQQRAAERWSMCEPMRQWAWTGHGRGISRPTALRTSPSLAAQTCRPCGSRRS